MRNNKIIIAIDGHSSCGKSTFAKAIAARLGYIFIDTGAMYRAVTLYALENGAITSGIVDEQKVCDMLGDIDIDFRFRQKRFHHFIITRPVFRWNKIMGLYICIKPDLHHNIQICFF